MAKFPHLITRWEHPCWQRESFQRNYAKVYLEGRVSDHDIIICSDCDEIIDKDTLDNAISLLSKGMVAVNQPLYINKFNLYRTDASSLRVIKGSLFNSSYLTSLTQLRGYPTVYGGWHFSYLYSEPSEVLLKFKSFSHAYEKEWLNDPNEAVSHMKSDMQTKYIPFSEINPPKYLLENIEKFKKHIAYE